MEERFLLAEDYPKHTRSNLARCRRPFPAIWVILASGDQESRNVG
jgi:hypothetical protein